MVNCYKSQGCLSPDTYIINLSCNIPQNILDYNQSKSINLVNWIHSCFVIESADFIPFNDMIKRPIVNGKNVKIKK